MTTLSIGTPGPTHDRDGRGAPGRRQRVLVAPVTVTPCKPLTFSHLKGLLWADVLYRATGILADTDYRYSHTTYDLTEQTLGFWEFLDRVVGDVDYAALSEAEIGDLYVRWRAEAEHPSADALRPYADAVEHGGWVHPATTRVLELWTAHYARLGLHDPGLTRHQPPGLGLADVLGHLDTWGMCLDQREQGGPVYLDLTRFGMPLRQLVTAAGRPNYLACALRDLLPLAPNYDEVVLLHDRELDADYQLLERVLWTTGAAVHRVPIGRVPIGGRIQSARHGDWHGHTVGSLLADAAEYEAPVIRLGLRLYFIATLGRGPEQSYRDELLRQSFGRARRLLSAASPGSVEELPDRIGRHRHDQVCVDPYRLTSSLLARHRPALAADLLAAVFL